MTNGPNHLKKLRQATDLDDLTSAKAEGKINGKEYELRLYQKFERMNPTPSLLAQLQRKYARGTQSNSDQSDSKSGYGGLGQLLQSTGKMRSVAGGQYRPVAALPQGELQVESLHDAIQAIPKTTKYPISAIQFHPQSPNLFTESPISHKLSFFKIDGKHHITLHHVRTPDLPVTTAEFCPSTEGSSTVLMTGNRPYFYTFHFL